MLFVVNFLGPYPEKKKKKKKLIPEAITYPGVVGESNIKWRFRPCLKVWGIDKTPKCWMKL